MAKKPDPASETQASLDPQPPVETPAAAGPVKVRLLVDYGGQKAGTLAVLDADLAQALVATGAADDHPDAVAYAEQLEKPE